jgi:hypothetical protein
VDVKTIQFLFDYFDNNEIHSILQITFAELFIHIYTLIETKLIEHKEEIYKIMSQEMQDAECKCFTGRISRLVNCLNGFDENIVIYISQTEQIGNVIATIRQTMELQNNYSLELFKEQINKELTNRNYPQDTINEWLTNIE